MEYRQLGGSGFKVPVLTLGTGTFGARISSKIEMKPPQEN
jgi:aryl-alcohol dehydrogenase-like predicted oxidoreductase